MRARIGGHLLARTRPADKPYEIYDTDLKGFTLRVQPSGVMSYVVRYRLRDGKQTRAVIGKHTVFSPAQARDEAKQILAGIAKGEDPVAAKRAAKEYSLESFIDGDYRDWVMSHRKDAEATLARIDTCFSEFGSKRLNEITPWIVEKWRSTRSKAGIKPSTLNRDISALRSVLSKAVEWGHLQLHPLSRLKPAKIDHNTRVRFLSDDEEGKLRQALDAREHRLRRERETANRWRRERGYPELPDLASIPFADHLKPMVLVSVNTGLRQGELFHLEWQDLDLERATVCVRGEAAKSGRTRYVPLNGEALTVLRDWRTQSVTRRLVFPGKDEKPFDNVQKSWITVLTFAGITHFRWHDMRHHFASRLAMAGVDLNTIRELLGHSDLTMTLRYAHLAPEHKAAAVAKLLKAA